jgi:iron complex transport system ATP-binding protein
VTAAASALSLDGVGVTLAGRAVVRNVVADLPAGELVALVGPNGAGKTTLLRALAGLLPMKGSAHYGARDLISMSPNERARLIAYLPQGHQAHWPLPAWDIVALGRYPHGVRDPARLPQGDAAIVDDALARADAVELARRDVQTLSGGERARIMMARVLAVQAPIVLADEPTAALDPRHQLQIMAVLQAEAARGALVVAVTHDITLAARFASRVLLMRDGALEADGGTAEVLTAERLRDVYRVDARPMRIDDRTVMVPWSAL